eukprot:105850-Rhodomonas_salina.1
MSVCAEMRLSKPHLIPVRQPHVAPQHISVLSACRIRQQYFVSRRIVRLAPSHIKSGDNAHRITS